MSHKTIDDIMRLLPQTQCEQCGFSGCRPYAEALIANEAPPNRCVPGGKNTWHQLCNTLSLKPSDPGELIDIPPEHTVEIVAADCIGCTKCINACPVDAIIGSHGFMHSVIESECTGCNLCIEPCPVDCIIEIKPSATHTPATQRKERSLARFEAKKARLNHRRRLEIQKHKKAKLKGADRAQTEAARLDYIAAARQRQALKRGDHE